MLRGFRRILVAHDFSHHADHAFGVALRMAAPTSARITVLHVASQIVLQRGFPPTAVVRPPTPAMLEELAAKLEARVRAVARGVRGLTLVATAVTGDPHQRIIEAARKAEVIVMGTHGLSGVAHLLIGSVAEKVVRHAPVPVVTVRARR
jgi:nucleotide-binding universal stress UspA family protein